jgi:leader peptidase (prepilin peptidase)/N-methyltransferase
MLSIAGGILLGLLVGSFLNVVVYRVPIMMQREWEQQTAEIAAEQSGQPLPEHLNEPFNLLVPRSRCPECATPIAPWHNIPVLSWLMLGGKCSQCSTPISMHYPLVELATGLLSGLVIWQLGATPAGAAGLFFVWMLISLSLIDIDHQLLPDRLTYLLLWAGLLLALFHPLDPGLPFADLRSSVAGAILGYLSLWSVYWLFKIITRKEGMGYGDFKLLAALGAWLGWQMLPLIILLSAVVGAITGIAMILVRGRDRQLPIPFGPYLAGAGLIALLFGPELMAGYLGYSLY